MTGITFGGDNCQPGLCRCHEDPEQEIRAELTSFGAMYAARYDMVRRARDIGLTVREIAARSGLGHATVDRVIARARRPR